MKDKPKSSAQFSLPLADSESKVARQTVISGRFKPNNSHLDAVSRRIAGSGVFAPKPDKK